MIFKKNLVILIFCSLTPFLLADESQQVNEIIQKTIKLKETNDYDSMIKLINEEIKKGNLHAIYFDILGGAYDAKKDKEAAYLSYLKGFFYNPSLEYARNKLVKKMNYIENRKEELEKDSWLYKYLSVKKLFDDNYLDEADKKLGVLLGEGKNLDILCIFNKDIRSLKGAPKASNAVITNLSSAESYFNKVIAEMGDNCPEYVYYEFADLLFKSEKYEKAIENYQTSAKKNILRRDNKLKLGACYLYTKDYVEAKKIFSECINKMPDYAEAHLYIGFSHWALKESEKALQAFSKVIELCQTSNTNFREKAKKAMEVVKKGDLFLTPNDMNKLMSDKLSQPEVKKEPSKQVEKKEETTNEKPTDK
jgi:predicted Zn-dependent protease